MLKKSIKAFTLLELIVVLVVLGILAALAIPTFTNVQKSSAYNVASATSKAIARDANAISASAGRSTTSTDINSAILETTAPSNATLTFNATGSATVVTANGGNNAQTCYVYISTGSATTMGVNTNSPGTTAC